MSKVWTTCSRRGTERSNPQDEAREGESVSRNASELASAPLDYPRVAKLPIKLKPATAEEGHRFATAARHSLLYKLAVLIHCLPAR